ncbi:MAG: hypothetical protein OXC00_15145, partial [Acidimicrobiaceae bacterium]|nr:hypothetical protein [Acidimicrobiaceae bacterium]
ANWLPNAPPNLFDPANTPRPQTAPPTIPPPAAITLPAAIVNNPAIIDNALVEHPLTRTQIRHTPRRRHPIDGTATGLGRGLGSALPANHPAAVTHTNPTGSDLGPAPRIRNRATIDDEPATIGPGLGLRRRDPAPRTGPRARHSPNQHHSHQHATTPRPAPPRRHNSPRAPHHITSFLLAGSIHSQAATAAASEAPHSSLAPSLT